MLPLYCRELLTLLGSICRQSLIYYQFMLGEAFPLTLSAKTYSPRPTQDFWGGYPIRNWTLGYNSAIGLCVPVHTAQPMGLFASFLYQSRMLNIPTQTYVQRLKRFSQTTFSNYVAAGNIFTDACLIILPISIATRLKVRIGKRIALVFLFLGRIW